MATKLRPVLVTTLHRGVFFGYASATAGQTVKLKKARNVLYWSEACKGFMGLAAGGPQAGSKLGPSVDIERSHGPSLSEVPAAAAGVFSTFPVWS